MGVNFVGSNPTGGTMQTINCDGYGGRRWMDGYDLAGGLSCGVAGVTSERDLVGGDPGLRVVLDLQTEGFEQASCRVVG